MTQTSIPFAGRPGLSGARSALAAVGRNHVLMRLYRPSAFLAFWQVVSMNVPPIILPSPAKVAVAFVQLTATGELLKATAATIWPFTIGLVRRLRGWHGAGPRARPSSAARGQGARPLHLRVLVHSPTSPGCRSFIAWFGVGNLTLHRLRLRLRGVSAASHRRGRCQGGRQLPRRGRALAGRHEARDPLCGGAALVASLHHRGTAHRGRTRAGGDHRRAVADRRDRHRLYVPVLWRDLVARQIFRAAHRHRGAGDRAQSRRQLGGARVHPVETRAFA